LLQYLAPVFQFALGVLYFKEAMPPERWAGFGLVWLALTLLTWDALRTARANRARAAELAAQLPKAQAPAPTPPAASASASVEEAPGPEIVAVAEDPAPRP
ncbi:EamA family transporter RarD, partial [Streptomyces albidoflavus]